MKFESVVQMAKAIKKPKRLEKPEKSQAELRDIIEQKLKSLRPVLQEGMEEYKQALKDDLFEDREGESEGTGEVRKGALQKKLTALFDRAEKIKGRLDSEGDLSQFQEEISSEYTHPDGQQETIVLNIESKQEDFLSFYQDTDVDLPPDFEDTIRDIWERNQTKIEQAIEQKGFDDMLIIPGNIPLIDLSEKMKMEDGYLTGSNFNSGGGFAGAVSQNVDKPRLILYHKIETLSEIFQKTGLDVHLNITGREAEKLYQQNPDQYLGTLEDFLILERKYLKDTGKHLSNWDKKSAHWLPGTKSGVRLVDSDWDPGDRRLNVNADGLEDQYGRLGVRPARCFF